MRLKQLTAMLICATMLYLPPKSLKAINERSEVLMRLGILQEGPATVGQSSRQCIVINADRTYHLERRVQLKTQVGNSLEIYEGKIQPAEFERLVELLEEIHHLTLSDFVPPKFPISISAFEMVTLDYPVDEVQRRIGYFEPLSESAIDTSPGNTPSGIRAEWRASMSAMKPLMSWLEHFQNSGLRRVSESTHSCSAEN